MPPKLPIVHAPSPSPPLGPTINEAHDLLIIQDMVDTFEQVPPELTRVHSDLNELGAVLYATLLNLEKKLGLLIEQIQDDTVGPEKRFELLQDIAEEAARYKLGGDDKIRVAAGACDAILTHQKHLNNLVESSTLFASAPPSPYTQALTLALPPVQGSSRRAVARAANSPFGGRPGASGEKGETPTKKRRNRVQQLGGRDDDEISSVGGEKKRPSHKKRKPANRALSPADSLGSSSQYTSKPPVLQTARQIAAAASKARKAEAHEDASDDESHDGLKPSGLAMQHTLSTDSLAQDKSSLGLDVGGPSRESSALRNATNGKDNGRAGRVRAGTKRGRDDEPEGESEMDGEEERPPPKRTTTGNSTSSKKNGATGKEEEGDGEGEGGGDVDADTNRYCICQQVSYGHMIGCDDDECEVEWFHLACVGLDRIPNSEDKWICPMCTERRKKHPKSRKPVKSASKSRK